jgi:hypothetical protein
MPDFSFDAIKFNPDTDGVSPPPAGHPDDVNSGDWSGHVLAGGPLGVARWVPLSFGDGTIALSQLTAYGRFTSADGTGKFGLGLGAKAASGSNSPEPMIVFAVAAGLAAIPSSQRWRVGASFTTNGVAIPGGTIIDVGFYRVTTSGSGQMVYTLNSTGAIVESVAGIAASAVAQGVAGTDRVADLNAAGNQVYALGIEIHTTLPANCVLDVEAALQVSLA